MNYKEAKQKSSIYNLDEWDFKNADKYLEWQKYKFDQIAFQEECLEKFVKGWVYDW